MGWQTLLVTCCTCFLAGSTFHHWVADHNTLWLNPTTEEAVSRAAEYYALLGSVRYTPLPYIWLGVAGVALTTMGWRAVRGITNIGGERFSGGYLFDAACCLLLGRVIVTQAKDVFPAVLHLSLPSTSTDLNSTPEKTYQALENNVKQLAGTNLTISVLLTGVICLQAGRFYAERSAAKKRAQYLLSQQSQSPSPSASGEAMVDSIESPTTPVPASPSGSTRTKGRRRAQTPYREMSQEELDELNKSGMEAK